MWPLHMFILTPKQETENNLWPIPLSPLLKSLFPPTPRHHKMERHLGSLFWWVVSNSKYWKRRSCDSQYTCLLGICSYQQMSLERQSIIRQYFVKDPICPANIYAWEKKSTRKWPICQLDIVCKFKAIFLLYWVAFLNCKLVCSIPVVF